MQTCTPQSRTLALLAGMALLALSGWAQADPPARVARLAYVSGAVSFSPAGEDNWTQANINRPLSNGDRLWTDTQARSEIQAGGATLRMNDNTSVAVVNLDDRITQLQLAQGSLHVRVTRLAANQTVEVDTPNLAFTLRQPGEYRISVDPQGDATDIIVRSGKGEAYGDGNAYAIDARQPYRFTGTGLRDYVTLRAPQSDAFDQWAAGRDRLLTRSVSARYVSPDVVGYQDLDGNGTWRNDTTYGNYWTPSRVANDWAPYRDGHWSWVDPWGWTWIDDAPWGFAVSHYGRWAQLGGSWGWIPGPIRVPAYYAPAVVAFVGGSNFQITLSSGNVGGVGWFPLGPREVYRPSYQASRAYVDNINHSNTVVNNTVINNTYNVTQVTQVVHVNRRVPGAVTAVPRTVFEQSQPVAHAAVRLSAQVITGAVVAPVASVVPTERSVHGGAAPGQRPPPRALERAIVVRTAPPAPHAGFAAQQAQLATHPGQPLDDGARKALKPAAAVPLPAVTIVAPVKSTPPVAPPPSKPMPIAAAQSPAAPSSTPTQTRAPGSATLPAPPNAAPAAAASAAAPPATAQSPRGVQTPGNSSAPPAKAFAQAPAASSPPVAARPAAAAPVVAAPAAVPPPKAEPPVPVVRTPPSRGPENRQQQRAPLPPAPAPQVDAVTPSPPAVAAKPAPRPAPPRPAIEAPTPAAAQAPAAAPTPAAVRAPAAAPTPAAVRAPMAAPAPAAVRPPAAAPAPVSTPADVRSAPTNAAPVRAAAPAAVVHPPTPTPAPAPQVAVPPVKADTAPPARQMERRPQADAAAQAPQAARAARGAPAPAVSASAAEATDGKDKPRQPNDKGGPKG